jgi:hypothetical protein
LETAEPLAAAAVHDTTDWALAYEVAVTDVGAPGTVFAGTTAFDAPEEAPVPAALVAVTVKVYEVPLVRPVTVQVVPLVAHVRPPGLDVTV